MVHRFGSWEIDERLCELRRDGRPVRIEPKVFRLLTHLVRHRDRVLSKAELLDRLWPGEHVSESALTWCLKEARKAVGDAGVDQRVIRTYQRQGYRFIAEAVSCDEGVAAASGSGAFVGRASELARIEQAIERLRRGQGGVIVLAGEPGIGKTRTAAEAAERASRLGVTVLLGRCYEGEGAPAYWPWIQIVRSCLKRFDRGAVQHHFGSTAADIVRIIPELARDLPGLTPTSGERNVQDRFRLFDSLTRALASVANDGALLLVLDDLHWADEPSLLLAQFFAAENRHLPVLLIGTYRDTQLRSDHPLHRVLASLSRVDNHDCLLLTGMTEPELGELLAARLQRAPALDLVRQVHRDSGGNPFFASEILRLLLAPSADAGRAESEPKYRGVPSSVRETIRCRVSGLPPETIVVLTRAAVVGREFDVETLAAVAAASSSAGAAPMLEVDRLAELMTALDQAVSAGLIESNSTAPGSYRFCHALVRETLYEDLPSGERAQLHARIGAVLVHRGADRLSEVAHHYFQSAPLIGAERALQYSVLAGDRARELLAYEEASEHYQRALRLLPSDDSKQRCELLLARGEMEWRAGHLGLAKQEMRAAAESARRLGSAELLARAALGFGGGFRGFEVGVHDEELVQLLEAAARELATAPPDSPTLRTLQARVWARLAVALYHASDSLTQREELTRQAVEMAHASGDTSSHLAALYCRQWALWGPDNFHDRLAAAEEMARLGETARDREMALHAARFGCLNSIEAGGRDRFAIHLAACERIAAELRQPYYQWYAHTLQALAALLDGNISEAELCSERAHRLNHHVRSGNIEQAHVAMIITLRVWQGRGAESEEALKTMVAAYPAMASWRSRLVQLYGDLERPQQARQALEWYSLADIEKSPRNALWLVFATGLADAAAYCGDQPRAALLYRMLAPFADRVVVTPGGVMSGSVARFIGKAAATLREWSSAEQHFERALQISRRLEAPLLIAQTQCDYGEMLALHNRSADRPRASKLMAAAHAGFERLGMSSQAARCRQLRRP